MSRYVLFSHDGFGLGHVRRNCLVAAAIRATDPGAAVTVISGVPCRLPWLLPAGVRLTHLPPLLKDSSGAYGGREVSRQTVVETRAQMFLEAIADCDPEVVIVDRHPLGAADELYDGLQLARARGARLVLGLRDILDEPAAVRSEIAGSGWREVRDLFDEAIVYGSRAFCDHHAEYGLPLEAAYCGWVAEPPRELVREQNLLAIAAGGGGDGNQLFELGLALLRGRPLWRGVLAVGPLVHPDLRERLARDGALSGRVTVATQSGCGPLFAKAAAVLQMAGYNSTLEALVARQRAILLPRRSPRREQAIRAQRLASLGLADVLDQGVSVEEVDWLLSRPRHLGQRDLAAAGLRFDGARRAAERVCRLAQHRRAA